jgi:hypothetical protein
MNGEKCELCRTSPAGKNTTTCSVCKDIIERFLKRCDVSYIPKEGCDKVFPKGYKLIFKMTNFIWGKQI